MTKQEQIEEMTKLIQAEYKQWLDVTGVIPEGTTYYAECMGCAIDSAETLYNAGYRKTLMKTKQEQIEEMAVIGCVRNPQAHTAEECAKCDFKQGQCNAYKHAEALYNAGYRKTFTSDTQKAFKEGYKKGCETCAQAWANGYNYGYKSGKEDGVKEFAEKVKAKSYVNDYCREVVEIEKIDELIKELVK